MKVSEILRAGKARIETRGWCQGDELAIFGLDGRCCAATAMYPETAPTSFNGAHDLFRAANGIAGSIGDWNDAPERTKEEVLAAYDKAITLAEQESQNVG